MVKMYRHHTHHTFFGRVEIDICPVYIQDRWNYPLHFDSIPLGTNHNLFVDLVLLNLNIDLDRIFDKFYFLFGVGVCLVYNEDTMNCLHLLDACRVDTLHKS